MLSLHLDLLLTITRELGITLQSIWRRFLAVILFTFPFQNFVFQSALALRFLQNFQAAFGCCENNWMGKKLMGSSEMAPIPVISVVPPLQWTLNVLWTGSVPGPFSLLVPPLRSCGWSQLSASDQDLGKAWKSSAMKLSENKIKIECLKQTQINL